MLLFAPWGDIFASKIGKTANKLEVTVCPNGLRLSQKLAYGTEHLDAKCTQKSACSKGVPTITTRIPTSTLTILRQKSHRAASSFASHAQFGR